MILADYIQQNLDRPFEWGQHDCVTFAANWLKLSTGVDYLSDLKSWTTAKEAAKQIKSVGGLENALDTRLKRINPNMAKDGDVALYKGAVCIFTGRNIVGTGDLKLTFNIRMLAEGAWTCRP